MKQPGNMIGWVLAIAVMLASLVWRFVPLSTADARLALVTAGPGQRLQVQPLAPWETDYFGRAHAVRWLAADRLSAMIVTVVDGSGNRRAVHDPGFCFRGAGWTVVTEAPLALPHGEARRVVLRRGADELEAVYWFSDGRRAYSSPARYWFDTTWRRLTFGRSGAEPVLVLVVPAQGRGPNWPEWLRRWPGFTQL
jgi:hypothetical protein